MLSNDKSLGSTEWFIVEYESDAYMPLESVERCLRNLQRPRLV